MKYFAIFLVVLLMIACKKTSIDHSPQVLLTKYNWYPYKQTDSFYSANLDTVHRVFSNLFDSCDQASWYKFYSNGKVDRILPCYLQPNYYGSWSLSADSNLAVSVGFPSASQVKLISIDAAEIITNTTFPYIITAPPAPSEIGWLRSTVVFKHK